MANKMLHTKAQVVTKAIKEDEGVVDVIGSSNVIDRLGDTIQQKGWILKNYKQNPVILWGHNQKEERPPIGKAVRVWVEDKKSKAAKLMFRVKFDLQDSFAAEIFRKVRDGFINTVSVGFLPVEWEEKDPDDFFSPRNYTKQELLELSFVPVPANPEALVALKGMSDKRFKPIDLEKAYPDQKEVEPEEKPYPNEHACRLKSPGLFTKGSFRSTTRKHKGKEYRIIMGKLKGKTTMTEQSYRYSKGSWSKSEASSHCKSHGGTFEAASETSVDKPTVKEDEKPVDDKPKSEEVPKTDDESKEEPAKADTKPVDTDIEQDNEPGELPTNKEEETEEVVEEETDKEEKTDEENPEKETDEVTDEETNEEETAEEEIDEKETDKEPDGETDKEPKKPEPQTPAPPAETKGVIPYKDHGTAPESATWDGPGEVSRADTKDLRQMCTWFDSKSPDVKSSYKLPHHKADGYKAVWRGVAAAMAALLGARGGTKIPGGDRKGIYNHLKKHYSQFKKDAPPFKMVEDQVLKGLDEEVHALILDREDRYMIRLIKKVLKGQKEVKKITKENAKYTPAQVKAALRVLDTSLSQLLDSSKKVGEKE